MLNKIAISLNEWVSSKKGNVTKTSFALIVLYTAAQLHSKHGFFTPQVDYDYIMLPLAICFWCASVTSWIVNKLGGRRFLGGTISPQLLLTAGWVSFMVFKIGIVLSLIGGAVLTLLLVRRWNTAAIITMGLYLYVSMAPDEKQPSPGEIDQNIQMDAYREREEARFYRK